MTDVVKGLVSAGRSEGDDEIVERCEYGVSVHLPGLLVFFFVRVNRKSKTSSWEMLVRSCLPNPEVKRLRTNSQVFVLFFLELAW